MKSNNISQALKLVLFSVSVLITCIVVSVIFVASEEARKISDSAIEQMNNLNNDISNSEIMAYHKTEIDGGSVINCVKKYLGDYSTTETAPVYVFVKTTAAENTYTNGGYITNIQNFTDSRYIKPTATFYGAVMKNSNDVIIGIRFTQR